MARISISYGKGGPRGGYAGRLVRLPYRGLAHRDAEKRRRGVGPVIHGDVGPLGQSTKNFRTAPGLRATRTERVGRTRHPSVSRLVGDSRKA